MTGAAFTPLELEHISTAARAVKAGNAAISATYARAGGDAGAGPGPITIILIASGLGLLFGLASRGGK